jgi:hypothetical protein
MRFQKGDREGDQLDKLKHENRRLKRELKAVRKMLDRYCVAEQKGLIEKNVIQKSRKREKKEELVERWKCYSCEDGVLELIIIGNRYFINGTNCTKHTKTQVFDDSVEGIRPDRYGNQ